MIEIPPNSGFDLYINAVCNLKCKHCFLSDEYFDGSQMSVQRAEQILSWANRNGITEVAILGGEPSLHPDLNEILEAARRLDFSTIRLVTNGGRRFHSVYPLIDDKLDAVYISLDGANAAEHDAVRGVGSFASVTRSIHSLNRSTTELIITTTIGRHNMNSVLSILATAVSFDADRINIHWLSPTGRAKNAGLALGRAEWKIVRNRLLEFRTQSKAQIDVQSAFDVGKPTDDVCKVRSRSNFQFMPSGAVHLCGLTASSPSFSGYIWDGSTIQERNGFTELKACHADAGVDCPLRREESKHAVCIYSREIITS